MYADAAVEVGKELGVPTVNLWKACIDYAGGWKEGEPIPGSKPNGRNEKLEGLFRDGLHFSPIGCVQSLPTEATYSDFTVTYISSQK